MFPRFPPTIYPAAFCIGVIASFRLPETGRFWLWAGLFAVLSGWLLRAWRQGCGVQAAAFALWLAIGAGYGIARTQYALSQQVPPQNRVQPVRLVLTVSGLPEQDAQGRVRFEGRAETEDGRRYTLVFSDYAGREWHAGEVWQVQARVKAAVGMRNAAGFDAEAQALANGWDGSATLGAQRFRLPENGWRRFSPDAWRARINAGWMRAAARFPDGAGLMSALAVGSRAALSAETQAALRPLGLNHLVSISGLHIGMVAWLAAWLVQRLLLLLPKMPVSPRGWAAAAGVGAAVFYAALAGFGVPALRSVAMVAVFALAWARQQAAGAWQAWQLAMAAVLALQPAAALSAGFWLSFGLVGALLWISAFRLPEKQSWRAKLKTAVRAQWAATLAGGVGTVALFGLLPVFSPLANAVAIPLFSWLLVPLALVCSILPWDMPKLFAAQIGEWVAHAVRYAGAHLPDVAFAQAPAPLVAAAAVAVLLVLLPAGARLKPLACCALAAFALYRPSAFEGSLNMTVFDVGQGLSVLLQTRSQNILFDTGTAYAAETALLPNLRALGVRRLHLLVLSHADDDHDGGFSAVRQRYVPEQIAAGQPENYPAARHCTGGTYWQADGVYFEWLTLPRAAAADNDASCVLRVIAGGHALVITGDLGQKGERKLAAQYGSALQSDVLVLGHHGSRTATAGAFANAVSPQWAVASSGFANPYGHPHPETLRTLAAHGITLLRTDTQGGLAFRFDDSGVHVSPLARHRYWWQKKPFQAAPAEAAQRQPENAD